MSALTSKSVLKVENVEFSLCLSQLTEGKDFSTFCVDKCVFTAISSKTTVQHRGHVQGAVVFASLSHSVRDV